jgi:hypothetical protein
LIDVEMPVNNAFSCACVARIIFQKSFVTAAMLTKVSIAVLSDLLTKNSLIIAANANGRRGEKATGADAATAPG